jgi:hypothetical protein
MSFSIPTRARLMSQTEYAIVKRVFGDTLPFTIPTSLLCLLGATVAAGFLGAAAGYLSGFVNAAYLMNVGSAYADMSATNTALLVHETTHVWQGRNSYHSLNYVFNSCISQARRGAGAYHYTPGAAWSSFNVEQQASIVEHWFASGEPESGDLWSYIRDYVRQGKTSWEIFQGYDFV